MIFWCLGVAVDDSQWVDDLSHHQGMKNNLEKARPKLQSKQWFLCWVPDIFQSKHVLKPRNTNSNLFNYKSKGQSILTLQHRWTGDNFQRLASPWHHFLGWNAPVTSPDPMAEWLLHDLAGWIFSHRSTHRDLPFSWSTGGYGGDWENKDLQSKNIHFYSVCIYDRWLIIMIFFV